MFRATRLRVPRRNDVRRTARLAIAVSLMLLGAASLVPAARAALAFRRGDVFLTGSGSVQEYTPGGVLRQTLPGTTGAANLCFDPAGQHLIVPGVGLFNTSGTLLPSAWAAVARANCVADGYGHVYVGGGTSSTLDTIGEYTVSGAPIRTFTISPFTGIQGLGLALAPNDCTVFYGDWAGLTGSYGEWNGCLNTAPSPPFAPTGGTDDLRILPDGRLVALDDTAATLFSASGGVVRTYLPSPGPINNLRFMSLDPDGTTMWLSAVSFGDDVYRFNIASGTQIARWTGGGPIAVYGPPLLGDANIAPGFGFIKPGVALAAPTRVGFTGQLSHLHLYLASGSPASRVIVGIYTNVANHPGTLLRRVTISSPVAGSWNTTAVAPLPVAVGRRLWLAVLDPLGSGGAVALRVTAGGGLELPEPPPSDARAPLVRGDESALGTGLGLRQLSAIGVPGARPAARAPGPARAASRLRLRDHLGDQLRQLAALPRDRRAAGLVGHQPRARDRRRVGLPDRARVLGVGFVVGGDDHRRDRDRAQVGDR